MSTFPAADLWRSAVPELPTADQIEHACRGLPVLTGVPTVDSAVELAAELAELHRERLIGIEVARVDQRRRMCAMAFDALAIAVLPSLHLAATVYAGSVGVIVDRLASWCLLVGSRSPIQLTDNEIDFAWMQVRTLGRGYDLLLERAAKRICRVPTSNSLLAYREFDAGGETPLALATGNYTVKSEER